ncbi:hypothetical protein DENSPDRAFT_458676 [Dentipellis sp. KUC8613]|nr:hypothetical protein DENSPDRAFT_458676 [Dentipellis sp. KUC8613]
MDVDISYLADRFAQLKHLAVSKDRHLDTAGVVGKPVWRDLEVLECYIDLVLALGDSDLSSLRHLVLHALPQSHIQQFTDVLARLPLRRLYVHAFLQSNGPRDIGIQRFFARLVSSAPALQVLEIDVHGDEMVDVALSNFVFATPLKPVRWPTNLKYLSITSVVASLGYHISFMLHHNLGTAARWFQAVPSLQHFSYGVAGENPAHYTRFCSPGAGPSTILDQIKYSLHPSKTDPGLYADYVNN